MPQQQIPLCTLNQSAALAVLHISILRSQHVANDLHPYSLLKDKSQLSTTPYLETCTVLQVLLRIGILRSQRVANDLHPYGFLKEKFLWALVSAVGIFCLGAGVTVAHGVSALGAPLGAMHDMTWNLAGAPALFCSTCQL